MYPLAIKRGWEIHDFSMELNAGGLSSHGALTDTG
jgi:hypothetical protein